MPVSLQWSTISLGFKASKFLEAIYFCFIPALDSFLYCHTQGIKVLASSELLYKKMGIKSLLLYFIYLFFYIFCLFVWLFYSYKSNCRGERKSPLLFILNPKRDFRSKKTSFLCRIPELHDLQNVIQCHLNFYICSKSARYLHSICIFLVCLYSFWIVLGLLVINLLRRIFSFVLW